MIPIIVPRVGRVVVLKGPVSTEIPPPSEQPISPDTVAADSPPLLELVLDCEAQDRQQPVRERKAILYHRSYTTGARHLVGIGGEYHSLPVEHSFKREDHSLQHCYPLHVIHTETVEEVLSLVERVAGIVPNSRSEAYLGQTIMSVVDGNFPRIIAHLTSTYESFPLTFVRATLVGSDVLDVGLSHQTGSGTAMRNLVSFFDLLGRYRPRDPDLRYQMLREVGWPCD